MDFAFLFIFISLLFPSLNKNSYLFQCKVKFLQLIIIRLDCEGRGIGNVINCNCLRVRNKNKYIKAIEGKNPNAITGFEYG